MAVKITQIAKDMNMKPKEITDFLKSIVLDKKSGDSLDTDEWSLFLDRLTKENQIENIDDYLSGKATLRVDRPAPKKKEAVKESEAHKEEQKPEEKKEEPKAEAKAERGAEEKKAPKTEGKKAEKQEQKVQPKPEERKPQQPQQQQQQSGKKKEKERKQRQSFKTIIPNMPISSNAPTEIVVPKNKTRVVDTRTTTVDLSRYDDRLDHIAAGKADLRGGHQKLKKQNNRPNGNAKGRDNRFSEREKMKQLEMEMARKKPLEITVPDEITWASLPPV